MTTATQDLTMEVGVVVVRWRKFGPTLRPIPDRSVLARCEALTFRGGRCLNSARYGVSVPGFHTDAIICGVHANEFRRQRQLEVLA